MDDPHARVEQLLGHRFAHRDLVVRALTHSSHAHERGGRSNERLELLGDAILNACTTVLIVGRLPDADEGALSRLRARLVDEHTLAALARDLDLGPLLLLGAGEESTGGRDKTRILADVVEAILGALYLDAGFERCLAVVERWLSPRMEALAGDGDPDEAWKHPRSRLQEITQERHKRVPTYHEVGCDGPDHQPVFHAEVRMGEAVLGRGSARSKKEAYRLAAIDALEALEAGEEI